MEEKRKISQRVAASIAAEIASGSYFPGERMPSERELAERYGVSRIALREATAALESRGLIHIRQGSGIWVAEPSEEATPITDSEAGAIELIEARRVLESEVAAIAANLANDDDIAELEQLVLTMESRDRETAETADHDFHLKLARITRNDILVSLVEQLWAWRYRLQSLHSLVAEAANSGTENRVDEHAVILDAIKDRSPSAARQAMRNHLDQVLECVLRGSEIQALESLKRQHLERRKAVVDVVKMPAAKKRS